MIEKIKDFFQKLDYVGIYYLLFQAINWLYYFIDAQVIDLIFKYSYINGSRKERKEANQNDKPCHVVNIVKMVPSMAFEIYYDLTNFLIKHDSYCDLEYITDKKNVSLFAVTKDNVIFAVTDETVDVFTTKMFPFTAMGQLHTAKKLVLMDHASFHKLAKKIGDPKVPVSLVNMTARCGSTLLTQMVSRVPKTRAMGEPYAPVHLQSLYQRGHILKSEYKDLLQSVMRVLCKVEPSSDIERIFIKTVCYQAAQFELIHELFPEMALFFNTRQVAPSFLSLKKIGVLTFSNTIMSKWGFYWRVVKGYMPIPYDNKDYENIYSKYESSFMPNISELENLAILIALVDVSYVQNPTIYKDVIFYEDLRIKPRETMENMFKHAKIPLEHVEAALSALKTDSQNDILAPRGEKKGLELTRDEKLKIDSMLKQFKIDISCEMSEKEFKQFFMSKRESDK